MILKFFNLLFRISLIFLICFVWVRYFTPSLSLSLIYTALLTLSVELLIHVFLTRKQAKFNLKKDEEKLAEKISSNFIYDPTLAVSYFYNLAKINYNAKKNKNFIVLWRKGSNETLEQNNEDNLSEKAEKTVIYPLYSYNPLSPQNFVEIIRKIKTTNATKLIVCCYKVSNETVAIAKKTPNIKIILLDSKGCFLKLIKPHNFYPQNLKEIEFSTKPKFKDVLKGSISKKRAKSYLISSLILLFSSFIVRMNIYYVIFSSILLALALVSFFFSPKNLKYDDNVL